MNLAEKESKSIIERKEREENLKKTDKSIVKTINDIKKYREAILNCKHFQNSYIEGKRGASI
jgi:formate-dependent nitrite reductase cytochrome c552 subunit